MEKFKNIVLFVLSLVAFEVFVIFAISHRDTDYKTDYKQEISRPDSSSDVSETPDKKERRRITNIEKGFIENREKVTFSGYSFIKRDELFDPQYVDGRGQSNVQRMRDGSAPIGKDGKPVELHHMKQREDGIIVELSNTEHTENTKTFHRYTSESEINREQFDKLRRDYWKNRAKNFN